MRGAGVSDAHPLRSHVGRLRSARTELAEIWKLLLQALDLRLTVCTAGDVIAVWTNWTFKTECYVEKGCPIETINRLKANCKKLFHATNAVMVGYQMQAEERLTNAECLEHLEQQVRRRHTMVLRLTDECGRDCLHKPDFQIMEVAGWSLGTHTS